MGNNTLCCSDSDPFGSGSKLSLQPNIAAHASFAGCQINLSQSKLLFNEDVDTIVLIVSTRLKMGQNIEDLLKKYGGQSVMNELKQVRLSEGGKLDLGQVVYTHAGDMEFDYIIYTVLSSCCETIMRLERKINFIFQQRFQKEEKNEITNCDFVIRIELKKIQFWTHLNIQLVHYDFEYVKRRLIIIIQNALSFLNDNKKILCQT